LRIITTLYSGSTINLNGHFLLESWLDFQMSNRNFRHFAEGF